MLLVKGRLLGFVFDCFFMDDFYLKIGKYVIDLVEELKIILEEKGYLFYLKLLIN